MHPAKQGRAFLSATPLHLLCWWQENFLFSWWTKQIGLGRYRDLMSSICARSLLMITGVVCVAQNHCMAQRVFWTGWRLFTDFQGWTGPLWRVWPRTNCHYFTNSSELTFLKCVTISHQLCSCLALQPATTKGFHCISVKSYQVYFTFLFISPFFCLLKRQNMLQSGLYDGFHCTLVFVSEMVQKSRICAFSQRSRLVD